MSRGKSNQPPLKLTKQGRQTRLIAQSTVNIVRDPKTITFAPGTLVLLIAAPGAGKSLLARTLWGNLPNHEIISTDELRAKAPNSAGEWDQSVSWWAFKVAHSKLETALKAGKTVIFDATNANPRSRKDLLAIAKQCNSRVEVVHFNLPVETCYARNKARGATDPMRQVEEHVIDKFHQAVQEAGAAIVNEPYARITFLSEQGQNKLLGTTPIHNPAPITPGDPALNALIVSKDPVGALKKAVAEGSINTLLPEFKICVGFDQKSKYHDLTLDEHIYAVTNKMVELTTKPELVWAAVLHDLGKPASAWPVAVLEGHEAGNLHFYANPQEGKDAHEIIGARIAQAVLLRQGVELEQLRRVVEIVRWHMFPQFKTVEGATKFLRRIGNNLELAEDLMIMREADHAGKPNTAAETEKMRELIIETLKPKPPEIKVKLVVRGDELAQQLRIERGPEIGALIKYLQIEVSEGRLVNNKQAILRAARKQLAK